MKELLDFTIIEKLLVCILFALFLIQLFYYLFIYQRIHLQNKKEKQKKISFATDYPPVSVIITTNDESHAIQKHLPKILEQDYPNFEVIVVNSAKSNNTSDILTLMGEKYPHLYHTFTPDTARYISKKKLALTLGIKASQHEWLLFTDVTCEPESNQWIKSMARHFSSEKEIVMGYAGYKFSTGWFHRKTHFDQFFTSMRYLGMGLQKKTYMALGKNLAFRKTLFYKNKGFSSFLQLQAGADDLFINQVATKKNTAVEVSHKGSICVDSHPNKHLWKEEKLGYIVSSHHYRGVQKYFLGFETTTRYLFYILSIYGISSSIIHQSWIICSISLFLLLLRFVLQCIILGQTSKDLHEKRYLWTIPLFDIILPLTHIRIRLIRLIRGHRYFMRKI